MQRGVAGAHCAQPESIPRENKSIRKSLPDSMRGLLRQSDFVLGWVSPSQSAVLACGWAGPVQRPFLPKIKVPHEQDPNIKENFDKPEPMQFAKNIRPRVEKNSFHIE